MDERKLNIRKNIKDIDGIFSTFIGLFLPKEGFNFIAIKPGYQLLCIFCYNALALVASYFFYKGGRWDLIIGSILILFSFLLNYINFYSSISTDPNDQSEFVKWLDSISDRITEPIFYLTLASGYYRATHNSDIWIFVLLTFIITSYKNYDNHYRKKFIKEWERLSLDSFFLSLGERYAVIIIFSALNRIELVFYTIILWGAIAFPLRSFLYWKAFYEKS